MPWRIVIANCKGLQNFNSCCLDKLLKSGAGTKYLVVVPRDAAPVFFYSRLEILLLYFRSSTVTRPEDTPDAEVHEKYIELMCKYQPDLVHSYLRNTENYRLEETLAVWIVIEIIILKNKTHCVLGEYYVIESRAACVSQVPTPSIGFKAFSELLIDVSTVTPFFCSEKFKFITSRIYVVLNSQGTVYIRASAENLHGVLLPVAP